MSIVTITETVPNPPIQVLGDSIYLRVWYSNNFVAGDGVTAIEGGTGQTGFYYNILCSKDADDNVVIPAFEIQATTESNPTANFFGQLYVNDAPDRVIFGGASGWQMPTIYGATINFGELALYNRVKRLLYPPATYPTFDQVIALINLYAGNQQYMAVGVNGIGSIDTAPALASLPIVIGTNSRRASDFYNIIAYGASTSKTAAQNATAIAAAITAAAITGGGIYVPVGTFSTNSVTISVPVEFALGSSILSPATGQTVTITKSITADASRHFANATSGLGAISFSGNTVQQVIRLSWFGVTATVASDQSAAYQAALTALGDGLILNPDVAGDIRVDSQLTLLDHRNIGIVGAVPMPYADAGQRLHKIRWYGANGGTVLRIDRVRDSQFQNFGIYGTSTGGSAGADIGMFITQDGAGTNISSNNTFQDVWVSPGNTRSGWIAAKVDNTSGQNNEQHKFRHSSLLGSDAGYGLQVGIGLYLGHGNVKEIVVEDCTLSGLAKGIKGVGGPSFYSSRNNFTSTAIPFEGPYSDVCSSIDDHSEGSTQVYDGNGGTAPFTMITPRFSDLHGGQASTGTTSTSPIIRAGAESMEVRGGIFQSVTGAFTSNFLLSTTGTGPITWKHNVVTGTTASNIVTGLNTFLYSDDDVRGGGQAIRGGFVFAGINNQCNGATPDLSAGGSGAQYSTRYSFGNGGATSITNFTNGFDGQVIILEGDTLTTLVNGSTLKTISGANIAPWGAGKTVTLMLNGTVWEQIGGVFGLAQGEGAALSISSNTIAPTNQIHQVGAGLIKTITVPSSITSGSVSLVPTAAFTYDATGNVLGTGTATIGRTMTATYSASTGKWSMSY